MAGGALAAGSTAGRVPIEATIRRCAHSWYVVETHKFSIRASVRSSCPSEAGAPVASARSFAERALTQEVEERIRSTSRVPEFAGRIAYTRRGIRARAEGEDDRRPPVGEGLVDVEGSACCAPRPSREPRSGPGWSRHQAPSQTKCSGTIAAGRSRPGRCCHCESPPIHAPAVPDSPATRHPRPALAQLASPPVPFSSVAGWRASCVGSRG
jgi:hypothetical protein